MKNKQDTRYSRQTNFSKQFLITVYCLFTVFLFLPSLTYAVTVIEVDTGGETINALEGRLVLPEGFDPGEIYTGESAILIWIVKPVFNETDNSITFSGLTPGGFVGKRPVFSINIDSVARATFREVSAFRNDGEGTKVPVILSLSQGNLPSDDAPPEPFRIEMSKSQDVFDGRHFISFLAHDKKTGVMRYDFASSWLLYPADDDWKEEQSPKVLTRTELFKRISIRALDFDGNYRTVSTPGPYWFITLIIGAIIFTCIVLLLRRSFHY